MATYKGRFQMLAKPASEWSGANPVLLLGEFGVSDPGATLPLMKVGDGVRPWSALPNLMAPVVAANDYIVGTTTTLPAGSSATVNIDNTVDPPTISFGLPAGATGPANSLAIGSVVTGPAGSGADASITGTPPNQILNLTIPKGDTGAQGIQGIQGPIGATGPANSLTIGTVTTGPAGGAAAADITGTPPNQTLNLTLPTGATGATGATGPAGPANSLTIGEVQTGAPGSAADAVITGAPPNQTLSLTIPRGDTGAQGIQGIQGPPGNAGTVLSDDSHVTGDWYYDNTQWFGHSAAQIADIKLNPQLYDAPSDALHALIRVRLERFDAQPVLAFQRINGSATAATGILGGQILANVTVKGLQPGTGVFAGAFLEFTATADWTATSSPTEMLVRLSPPGAASPIETHRWTWGAAGEVFLYIRRNALTATRVRIDGGDGMNEEWVNVSAPANTQSWVWKWIGGSMYLQAVSDAGVPTNFWQFSRAAGVPAFARLATQLQVARNDESIQLIGDAGTPSCYTGYYCNGLPTRTGYLGHVGGAHFNVVNELANGLLNLSASGVNSVVTFNVGTGEGARITSAGAVQVTGGLGGGFNSKAGVELGMVSTRAFLQAYNRATSLYLGMTLAADEVDISAHNTSAAQGKLTLGGRNTFRNLNDGYLRMNDNNEYANGIYTAGGIRADAGFVTDSRLQNLAGSQYFKMNNGVLSYGTCYCQGTGTGFHGFAIADGGLTPTFMSNNDQAGVYIVSEGKWLMKRDGATSAASGYVVSAPGFTTTSSRTIKRETGAPTRAATLLARLRPILYRLLADDDREQLGLIAEEVHEVCPQLSDGKTVSYDRLALLLLADWQDQRAAA